MESGFKIGRCYRHASGQTMRIVGSAFTHLYGPCLVGETSDSANLMPVGPDPTHAENWTQISEEEYSANLGDASWSDLPATDPA